MYIFIEAHFFRPPLPFFFPYIYVLRDFLPEHFHFLRDKRSGEFGFFAAVGCFFIWPADLAQYDFLLLAAFDPFLTLPVTAVFNLDPGFNLLYLLTPALVIPAPDFVDL